MSEPFGQQSSPQAGAPLTEAEDRQWASFAHLGGILSVLPSLIIWLVFKDRGRFTDQEGKEALNFQITVAIVAIATSLVLGIIGAIPVIGLITLILSPLAWLAIVGGNIALCILAFLKTKDGVPYRYPFAIRFIK